MATDNSSLNNPKGGGTGTADLKTSGFSQMDDQVDPQEYARLLDLYDNSFRNIAEGEVVKGTVLKVTPSEVIVDVGYKSEGIIPVDEFIDETGQISVQPGDMAVRIMSAASSNSSPSTSQDEKWIQISRLRVSGARMLEAALEIASTAPVAINRAAAPSTARATAPANCLKSSSICAS